MSILLENSENYNNKDLLSTYAYTHCVIFSRANLELIWSKSDSKPLFKCSFEKKEGVLLWKFDVSEYQKSLHFIFENKFPRFAFTKKNHTQAKPHLLS